MNGFKEFFVETYDLDLLMEVSTLAQTLKLHQDPELVKLVKGQVRGHLSQIPFFAQPMGKKMLDRHVNYFSYHVLQDSSWMEYIQKALVGAGVGATHADRIAYAQAATSPNLKFELSPTEIKQDAVKRVGGVVGNMWRDIGDYFGAMGNRLTSKLNNPGYTLQVAEQESDEWHEDIASRERGLPNQEAETIITLDHLGGGWKGWKWVDLKKGECSDEAKAMGHCGNAGGGTGDNIVSLRDSEGYAHLTFILNDGFLGEAKGRGNNKPSEKYHKPILELLKSKHIESIKGGGYKPENNFSFHDLHDDHKKELEHKPNINEPFDHMMEKHKGSPKKMVDGLNGIFESAAFKGFDGTNFSLEDFKGRNIKKRNREGIVFDSWIGPFGEIEESSKGWEREVRVGWLDDMEPEDAHHGWGHSELIGNLNAENKKRITDHLKSEVEDFEEHDLDELIGEDDNIMQVLDTAAGDAQSEANQSEAWENVQSQLGDTDEHGFYIDFKSDPWSLKISLGNVKALYATMTNDDHAGTQYETDVDSYVTLHYSEPQGGHYGHVDDEHYNYMVSDKLHEIIG